MKSVNELGISPMPWELMDDGFTIVRKQDEDVYGVVAEFLDENDARMAAAAPELYEALHHAIQLICDGCDYENCEEECRECPRHWWRDVLAKAAGEEAGE